MPLLLFLADKFDPHPDIQLPLKFKIISPVWLSATLNSDTATPSTFVLTAVIEVPETFASPVVIVELPPVFLETEFCPVTADKPRLLLTVALLVCLLFWEAEELIVVLFADPSPLPLFWVLPPKEPGPPPAVFWLATVIVLALFVAFPVLIEVLPKLPFETCPVRAGLFSVPDTGGGEEADVVLTTAPVGLGVGVGAGVFKLGGGVGIGGGVGAAGGGVGAGGGGGTGGVVISAGGAVGAGGGVGISKA